MNDKLLALDLSAPVRSSGNVRPRADRVGHSFTAVQHAAILDYYGGSVKDAAYALGEGAGYPRLDESQMQREFRHGNFDKFNRATDQAKACVALAVASVFGTAANPKAEVLALTAVRRGVEAL